MEVTKEVNQMIAELYLQPVIKIVDAVLQNPVFLKSAEASLRDMKSTLGTAQAVSGILLDMNDVDIRAVQCKTYEAAIKLLQTRHEQQQKTIEAKSKQCSLKKLQESMGF